MPSSSAHLQQRLVDARRRPRCRRSAGRWRRAGRCWISVRGLDLAAEPQTVAGSSRRSRPGREHQRVAAAVARAGRSATDARSAGPVAAREAIAGQVPSKPADGHAGGCTCSATPETSVATPGPARQALGTSPSTDSTAARPGAAGHLRQAPPGRRCGSARPQQVAASTAPRPPRRRCATNGATSCGSMLSTRCRTMREMSVDAEQLKDRWRRSPAASRADRRPGSATGPAGAKYTKYRQQRAAPSTAPSR